MKKIFLDKFGRTYKLKVDEYNRVNTHKGYFLYEENKKIFKTNKGYLFFKSEDFVDKLKEIEKGPQTSHFKDLGLVFAKILPQKEWIMLEAGTGSGQVTIFFSKYVKKIYSFEKRKEFFNLAKRNIEELGINNVELFNSDLVEVKNINEKFDFVFLDLGDPWKYIDIIYEKMRHLGFLVVYFVSPRQLDVFFDNLDLNKFVIYDIFEVIERGWEIKKKEFVFSKPRTTGLLFTSIVAILRKI